MTAIKQEYWLFQYTEGVRVEGEFESSKPSAVVRWKLTRYKKRIKEGDIIFFWRAGRSRQPTRARRSTSGSAPRAPSSLPTWAATSPRSTPL